MRSKVQNRNMPRKLVQQAGMAIVEFAIVSTLMMTTLFAAIEFGRAYFTFNMLEEVTRRGARMAAVCLIRDTRIPTVAVFGDGAGDSTIIPGLSTANIVVTYHRADGSQLTIPSSGAIPDTTFGQIELVRVAIQDFDHELIIPGLNRVFGTPSFVTTLPSESLGVTRDGLQAC